MNDRIGAIAVPRTTITMGVSSLSGNLKVQTTAAAATLAPFGTL